MKVRLTQSWGQWSKDHVFPDMPGGQARTLIARNIAEELVDEVDAKEFTSPMDRMMRAGRDSLTKGRRK